MRHQPCSPATAPSDYNLFPHLMNNASVDRSMVNWSLQPKSGSRGSRNCSIVRHRKTWNSLPAALRTSTMPARTFAYAVAASLALGIFYLFYQLGLQQLVRSPTRNNNNNMLNIILSNDFNCACNVDIAEPLNSGDLNSVLKYFFYNANCITTSQSSHYSPDFDKSDWDVIDFDHVFSKDQNVELIFDHLYQIICSSVDLFVPYKCSTTYTKRNCMRCPASVKKLFSKKTCCVTHPSHAENCWISCSL